MFSPPSSVDRGRSQLDVRPERRVCFLKPNLVGLAARRSYLPVITSLAIRPFGDGRTRKRTELMARRSTRKEFP